MSALSRRLLPASLALLALAPAALAQPADDGAVDLTADDDAPAATVPAAATVEGGDEVEEAVEDAKERLRSSIRVLQQRPVLKRLRLEVQAEGGTGLDDRMYRHAFVNAQLRLNINEDWAIGLLGNYYFTRKSRLFDAVTDDFEVFPEISRIEWSAGLDLGWTPVHGKMVFGQKIVPFDLTTLIGGGVTVTSRSDTLKPTGVLGLAWRVYVTKWMAVVTEVRDHIFVEDFNAGDEIVNHVVIQAGFSFFLPPGFRYRFPR